MSALLKYDPSLEVFNFDYSEIARYQNISIDEAKIKFNHIEVNTSKDKLAIQITIYNNYVYLNIPFWYRDNKAIELFIQLDTYLKIIHSITGYYAYSPQTGNAFDPSTTIFNEVDTYERGTKIFDELSNKKKPWWKFW